MVRTLVEATIRSLCALQAKSHRCRSPQRTYEKQCSDERIPAEGSAWGELHGNLGKTWPVG